MPRLSPPGSTATVQVPDAKAETLLADGWTVAGSPVVPEPSDDEATCPECGFVAKTPGGLAAHARKHDS